MKGSLAFLLGVVIGFNGVKLMTHLVYISIILALIGVLVLK